MSARKVCDGIPDVFPELRGDGVWLRALSEDDLPAWYGRLTDVEAAALAGDPLATSMQTVIDGLAFHRNAFRTKQAIRWSIVPDIVGESVGTIGLGGFVDDRLLASLGAAIGRRHWGLGIATAAARLVINYAFASLDLEIIEAVTLPENMRVARVLDKLRFRHIVDAPAPRIGERTDTLLWRKDAMERLKR
jgi:ribosomal-protein-alanine N-acetyltransferase